MGLLLGRRRAAGCGGGEGTRRGSHLAFSTIGRGVVKMGDDKASPSRPAGSDRELLMAGHSDDIEDPPKLGQPPPSAYHSGREVRFSLSGFCSSILGRFVSTSSSTPGVHCSIGLSYLWMLNGPLAPLSVFHLFDRLPFCMNPCPKFCYADHRLSIITCS